MNTAELEHKLSSAIGKEKIDLLNELAWELRDSDPKRALKLSEEAYASSTSEELVESYLNGLACSLRNLAFCYERFAQYDESLTKSEEALKYFETLKDLKGQAQVIRNIGTIHISLGSYPEALNMYLRALKLSEADDDILPQAGSLLNLGFLYEKLKQFQESLESYQKALPLAEKIKNHYLRSLLKNNMAFTFVQQKKYHQALAMAQESLDIANENDYQNIQALALDTLGATYLGLLNFDKALINFQQSLKVSQATNRPEAEMTALLNIAKVYQEQGNLDKALINIEQALALAKEHNFKAVIFECHEILANIYEQKNKADTALAHYKAFHIIKEEIFNQEADNKLKNLEVLHRTETARKEAEIFQLRNVRLEQEISERKKVEAELVKAKELAESASEAKSTFLATMSHELRTPLNAILGYAQIIKGAPLSEFVKEKLNIIERSGTHLLTIINDILDIAKIEAGKIDIAKDHFFLPEMIKGVCDMMRIRAESKKLNFNYQSFDFYQKKAILQLPQLAYGDVKRLRQVLTNLLGNAVKFTDTGSVTFKVGPLNGELIRFQVEDTGVGINEEDLSKIFESFEQVGQRSHKAQGTGLGLSISRNLVSLMGGELKVKSQLDQGSTFWFEVPLKADEASLPEFSALREELNSALSIGNENFEQPILLTNSAGPRPISLPAQEEVQQLLVAALRGDVMTIQQKARELIEQHEFEPFAQEVLRYVDDFQIEELCEFLQDYK